MDHTIEAHFEVAADTGTDSGDVHAGRIIRAMAAALRGLPPCGDQHYGEAMRFYRAMIAAQAEITLIQQEMRAGDGVALQSVEHPVNEAVVPSEEPSPDSLETIPAPPAVIDMIEARSAVEDNPTK